MLCLHIICRCAVKMQFTFYFIIFQVYISTKPKLCAYKSENYVHFVISKGYFACKAFAVPLLKRLQSELFEFTSPVLPLICATVKVRPALIPAQSVLPVLDAQ